MNNIKNKQTTEYLLIEFELLVHIVTKNSVKNLANNVTGRIRNEHRERKD